MPAKQNENYLNNILIGGLGTGCIKFMPDMQNEFLGLVKTSVSEYTDKTPQNVNPVKFFVNCKSASGKNVCEILGNVANDGSYNVRNVKTAVKKVSFAEFEFEKTNLENVDISLTAFNPIIIHNAIDSAIPAAFFEFEFANNTENDMLISLGTSLGSFFSAGKSVFGYFKKSGIGYATLTEVSKSVAPRRRGSISISTDCSDFSYVNPESDDINEHFSLFSKNGGFLSDNEDINNIEIKRNISVIFACHKNIPPHGKEKIRVVISWNFPYFGDGSMRSHEKNHYSHYFPNSENCIKYCANHYERLYAESLGTKKLFENVGMSDRAKSLIFDMLGFIKTPFIRRDYKGILHSIPDEDTERASLPMSFTLEYLFPGLTAGTTERTLKNLILAGTKRAENGDFLPYAYDADCTDEQIYSRIMLIVRLYRNYKWSSDVKFFAENWVDISCMVELLVGSLLEKSYPDVKYIKIYASALCAIKAMIDVATVLADRKRKMYYLNMFDTVKARFSELILQCDGYISTDIIETRFIAENMCGLKLYDEEIFNKATGNFLENYDKNEFYTCAALEMYGKNEVCERLLENINIRLLEKYPSRAAFYDSAMLCGLLFLAYAGFDYDKNTMTIRLAPDERFCGKDRLLRGFISFDSGYGYAEQGINDLEIIMMTGETKVRKILCVHKPYKALYGGRHWSCDIDDVENTITLDSNLIVSKNKKLTLLIDLSN